MKIALFGSTGFLGSVLLQKALNAGYEVNTLVRNPDKLTAYKNSIEYVQGNIFDPVSIRSAISGTEVVLSTVGPSRRDPNQPHLYEQAMVDLVEAMKACGISRIIHTGGAVHAGGENEHWTLQRQALRLFLVLFASPVLEAKRLEWKVLKKSGLDWTLVRPPAIVESVARRGICAEEKNLASLTVNVEDLADFMLRQIVSREWIGKAPLVASSRK